MDRRAGRPKSSSRETLAEAACELFLEQGFEATSIAEIASRAGVSRSSFFNYFSSKSDILWGAFDERLDAAAQRLDSDDAASVPDILRDMAAGFAPDSLALAVANAEAMGLAEELDRERAVRLGRLARCAAERFRRDGLPRLAAEVVGAAAAGAVLAAVWEWADAGPGHTDLTPLLDTALELLPALGANAGEGPQVRQLRVVVTAEEFDEALVFYRDVVGMPQTGAYEAEGGARVAILDAGRATLELANPAQVRFIDRVETDGETPSDRIRIALEVDDTEAVVARLEAGGAVVEASARETPWRSVNARLRGAAGLQLTVFQELGPEQRTFREMPDT